MRLRRAPRMLLCRQALRSSARRLVTTVTSTKLSGRKYSANWLSTALGSHSWCLSHCSGSNATRRRMGRDLNQSRLAGDVGTRTTILSDENPARHAMSNASITALPVDGGSFTITAVYFRPAYRFNSLRSHCPAPLFTCTVSEETVR